MSIALASAEGGVGELTEVRRIAQFFRIMRIVRIFKVIPLLTYNDHFKGPKLEIFAPGFLHKSDHW